MTRSPSSSPAASRAHGAADKPLRQPGAAGRCWTTCSAGCARRRGGGLNANGDPARFAGYGLAGVPDGLPDYPGPLAASRRARLGGGAPGGAAMARLRAGRLALRPARPRRAAACGAGGRRACRSPARARPGRRIRPIGLWPVALRDDLRAALAGGERKIDRWTARHGCAFADWPADPIDPFFNANAPEDLAEAERLLQGAARATIHP
jgi:molybdopterin-guanine dinucleotide biosynthesis protein A